MKTKNIFAASCQHRISVTVYMRQCIAELIGNGKKSTAHNYQSALNSFNRFLQGRELFLDELESTLIEAYEVWLEREGLSQNSSSFYMRQLRAIWNKSITEGLVVPDSGNPFENVFTGTRKTAKRGLLESSILSMERNLNNLLYEQAFALSMFLFCYYTRGMSFIDLAHLKKTDIKNGMLIYVRHKTGKQLQIEILPQMQAIIDRYAQEVANSLYLFPILQVEGKSKNYENALRLQNKRLAKVSVKLGLSVILTTHVARHSWASVARDKNISIHIISEAMGHSSILVTQIYLSSLNGSVINEANRIVLSKSKKQKGKYYESA